MSRTLEEDIAKAGGRTGQIPVELRSTVPASPASIALVRSAIRGFVDGWRAEGWVPPAFDDERACDLALVITELITNAVLHSGCSADDRLIIRVGLADGKIDGSVIDPGQGFSTAPGATTPRVDGGLGLFIVGRLVREWGVRDVAEGNEVWFRF